MLHWNLYEILDPEAHSSDSLITERGRSAEFFPFLAPLSPKPQGLESELSVDIPSSFNKKRVLPSSRA